ncbi:hypothetical protein [Urechidicola croceus]|uniref:Nicotinate-nucleotide adenylyltransferase n=1 Tax=Urechidicola croceus TaxID=1850246 RepID=A0A1D8P5C8_9FLAO|nr:hypothetical protein [Urechidicola croceus]AOW19780.1 hypothetical protein LPB138_03365 [Urechidicola croceus]
MKTLVIGFIFLGLTNLTQAQNDLFAHFETSEMHKTKVTPIKNATYLASTTIDQPANRIVMLHNKVANYNIKDLAIYTPSTSTTYDVIFKLDKNVVIEATYNHKGDIIYCNESFEAVKLPYSISSRLAKENPGWHFNNTWCTITYSENNPSKTIYKVQLKKGNKRKTIKIEP